ncbi:GEVED domain-containing protein [Flavobacterium hauense]
MKTQLHYLFVLFCTFLCSVTGHSQANYTQNFENYAYDWDSSDFYDFEDASCGGSFSFAANLWAFTSSVQAISPSLGTSNGGLVTFNYNYKLLNYNEDGLPNVPTANAGNWGAIGIYYATSEEGPFTLIQTINPSNHFESATCAAKTVTFNPPPGVPVYVGIQAVIGSSSNDFYVILDDFQISQAAPLACTGTPPAATATASKGIACNTTTINFGYSPANNTTGLTYQWQSSTDGTTFTNVATGGTAATYSTTQTATRWYRVNITCTASSATTTSAPVRVLNTGTNCYCQDLAFENGVEPITSVNFAGINNQSAAGTTALPYIQDFTSLPPASVSPGQSYPIILKGDTAGEFTNYFKVYIDFNQNGILSDPGEGFEIGSIFFSTGVDAIQLSGNITIPASALPGTTLMRIVKLFQGGTTSPLPQYLNSPCAGELHSKYGQAEDYLVTIAPCLTAAPTATPTQTVCTAATVANLTATGTGIKWYAAASGGTALAATQALVNGTTYYASQTIGCEGSARVAVTANFAVVTADDPADVIACTSYTLPVLTNGVYRTAPAGGGTVVTAGTAITTTTTLYVYASVGPCSVDNPVLITIGAPVADDPEDVVSCGAYTLPVLTSGGGVYRTATNGGGAIVDAGTVITQSTTLYVYAGTATCSDENSFTIAVSYVEADDKEDVLVCSPYELPGLSNGNYFTEPGGLGAALQPGDMVTEDATIYIYNLEGTCSAENSFTVTITSFEVDELDDVTVCFEYILPELTSGAYYSGGSGLGTMFEAGDAITETMTVHIYGASPINQTCTAETTFTVIVVGVVADLMDDVTTCSPYVLPALSAGNSYYSGPGGTGSPLSAGDLISESATVYVYAESDSSLTCTDETSFVVTVTPLETPENVAVTIEHVSGAPVVTLGDVEIDTDLQGTVTVYASLANAEDGVNPLGEDYEITDDTVLYATVTVGDCTTEPFMVTVDVVLDTDRFDMAAFSYYPNPVNDVLNLEYSENITGVEVYSLVGQRVISGQYNSTNVQLNLSQLALGTYMVKVSTENASKTIKVVKNK